MPFVILFTTFIVIYGSAHFLGRRFRYLIPQGKEFEVGLACGIGIMVIFMTKNFWFTTPDTNDLYFTIGFALSLGLTSSFMSLGDKRRL